MRNVDMTVKEIVETSLQLQKVSRFFTANGIEDIQEKTLAELSGKQSDVLLQSLLALEADMKHGVPCLNELYTEEEHAQDPDKKNTQLIFMPGKKGAPFVLICPGGAYAECVSYHEGFPIAYTFNQMGYNAFILFYRVNEPGLLPKPIHDLARAVKLIFDRAIEFGVSTEHYAVAGFSAGGHLAAEWGTKNHGFSQYGLPAPSALLLLYPASSTDAFYDDIQAGRGTAKFRDVGNLYLSFIGGKHYTRESLEEYCVEKQVDEKFPPCYIMHCEDDSSVPFRTSVLLKTALDENGVPCVFHPIKRGEHGFALGIGAETNAWVSEAKAFWEGTF